MLNRVIHLIQGLEEAQTVSRSTAKVVGQLSKRHTLPLDPGPGFSQLGEVLGDGSIKVNSGLKEDIVGDEFGDGPNKVLRIAVQMSRSVGVGLSEMVIFP